MEIFRKGGKIDGDPSDNSWKRSTKIGIYRSIDLTGDESYYSWDLCPDTVQPNNQSKPPDSSTCFPPRRILYHADNDAPALFDARYMLTCRHF
jgi:hypothetical protein